MRLIISSIFLLLITAIFYTAQAQPNYYFRSGIGIQAGITNFNIATDNFETTSDIGWTIGLHSYADIEHKWYNFSYGMNFAENNFGILGRVSADNLNSETITLDYKLLAAQIGLLMHAKPFKKRPVFTIDYGAFLQVNGKLELHDEAQEVYFIDGFDELGATEIEEISPLNLLGAIGGSVTVKSRLKFKIQYLYGINNTLNKLNKQTDLDQTIQESPYSKFLGHSSQLFGAVVFYL